MLSLSNKMKIFLIKSLTFLSIFLYLLFLTLDFISTFNTSFIKYLFLLSCLAYTFFSRTLAQDYWDWQLLMYGLMCTACADIFLLFTSFFSIGIGFFCATQLFYLKRLLTSSHFQYLLTIWIVFCFLSLSFFSFYPVTITEILAICYALLLLSGTVATFITHAPVHKHILQLAMCLFILCDLNVALFNSLPRTSSLYHFTSIAMWFFYAPSQFLLSRSFLKKSIPK